MATSTVSSSASTSFAMTAGSKRHARGKCTVVFMMAPCAPCSCTAFVVPEHGTRCAGCNHGAAFHEAIAADGPVEGGEPPARAAYVDSDSDDSAFGRKESKEYQEEPTEQQAGASRTPPPRRSTSSRRRVTSRVRSSPGETKQLEDGSQSAGDATAEQGARPRRASKSSSMRSESTTPVISPITRTLTQKELAEAVDRLARPRTAPSSVDVVHTVAPRLARKITLEQAQMSAARLAKPPSLPTLDIPEQFRPPEVPRLSPSQLEESLKRLANPRYSPRIPFEHDPTPAPGGLMPIPSFVNESMRQNKGVQFGHRLASQREIEEKLGVRHGPAPGADMPIPSFVEENKRQNKGVQFGHRLKDRREIERTLGYPEPPAPGGNVPLPSFVEEGKRQKKGVQFGHRLKDRREIERALGYPEPPGPGGLLPVPSFVEDNKRESKGVQFGHRLKDRREIERALGYPEPPGPGGLAPVPSFVEDSRRQSKGVQFGHKLKSQREIEVALGYGQGPAPGDLRTIPSFTNEIGKRGVKWADSTLKLAPGAKKKLEVRESMRLSPNESLSQLSSRSGSPARGASPSRAPSPTRASSPVKRHPSLRPKDIQELQRVDTVSNLNV